MQFCQIKCRRNSCDQKQQYKGRLTLNNQKQCMLQQKQLTLNISSNNIPNKKIISFSKQKICNAGRTGRNFRKSKELKINSNLQFTQNSRARSTSTYSASVCNQDSVNSFLQDNSINKSIREQSKHIKTSSLQFLNSFHNISQESLLNFNKTIGQQNQISLNWGNKKKKKSRRLTGLVDYGKLQSEQSTFDSKKEETILEYKKFNKLQFKACSKTTTRKNNLFSQKKEYQLQNIDSKILSASIQHIEDDTIITKPLSRFDFQIGRKLGSGNFGEAYLVKHKKTGLICAMKIMSKKKIKDQSYQQQITRQITIQSYFRHQNIVQLYGYFQDFQNVYLLMEYCTEGHLYGLIRQFNRLQNSKTSEIVAGISKGIQYIHRQMVIHRDLKPQNVFLNFGVAKIGDFGWAVYRGHDGLLRKTISGSPLYYSPQIVQQQQYNQKIDIWGLGTITFECLVGMAPFKVYSFQNLSRIVQDQLHFPSYIQIIPEAIDFIERCLQKRPEDRWSIQKVLKHQFLHLFKQ